jgi:hypothetical protein
MDLRPNRPVEIPDTPLHEKPLLERIWPLAHMRKTPNVLYGIFTELTRQFYANRYNLPLDVDFVYSSDPAETQLWIGEGYRWEDENPELRPAIYLKLAGLQYKTATGRHDSFHRMDLETGEKYFSRLGQGTVTWVHVGRLGGEALSLCGSTLDWVDGLSSVIRDDFCFETLELVAADPDPKPGDDESKERWRTTVTVAFTFQDTYRLKLESPKLKRVVFDAKGTLAMRLG